MVTVTPSLSWQLAAVVFVVWITKDAVAQSGKSQTATRASVSIHQVEYRSVSVLLRSIRDALRTVAATATGPARQHAIQELIHLAIEIRVHPNFSTSASLQKASRRIRSRLRRTLEALLRNAREQASVQRPAHLAPGERVLAQQAAGRLPPNPIAGIGPPAAGGPAALATRVDHADELIAIIQQSLHTDIWSVNGGTATISYYGPSMALVVRAPTEVHEDLARLLTALRTNVGP